MRCSFPPWLAVALLAAFCAPSSLLAQTESNNTSLSPAAQSVLFQSLDSQARAAQRAGVPSANAQSPGAQSPGVQDAVFQQPSKDELQMTADPKAPGAVAVYLYREEVTSFPARSRTLYERVKVLADKGKELANVRVPYQPGWEKVDVQARTIHADGTIVPMTESPASLMDAQSKRYESDVTVFTLPSVEVGSILEYRVTIHSTLAFPSEPTWNIQQPYFVHKAHYAFVNYGVTRFSYSALLGPDAKVQSDGKSMYTLDMADIAPLPDDDWVPPLNTFMWYVSFFISNFSSREAFWEHAEHDWAAFANEYAKPTGKLKDAAASMYAHGDSDTLKAQKIYAEVMKLENTDFTRAKSAAERKKEKIKDIHNAQDVWKEHGGTANEIAMLYVALCRAAGLNVVPMKVVDRSRAMFNAGYLSSGQLDDYIAAAQLDGKEVYLDPGDKACPFGMLHWRHMLATGFRLTGKTAILARTPASGTNSSTVARVADLAIDESGETHGTVRVILSRQNALLWRELTIISDEDEVRKLFNEWMKSDLPDGVQCEFDHFLGLDDYASNLIGIVRINGSLGTATGKRMMLPGFLFESKAKHSFLTAEKRTIPVDVEFARTLDDDVTYHFPASYKLESSPKAGDLPWPERADFTVAVKPTSDGVNVTRKLVSSYTVLDAKEYDSLHDFYVKVANADQQLVVLARAAAGQ